MTLTRSFFSTAKELKYRSRSLSWLLRFWNLIIVIALGYPATFVKSAPPSQDSTPAEKAQTTLDHLSPEERVGQLFLVNFHGMDVGPESQIYDLVVNYHIGGLILLAANDNLIIEENALDLLLDMNRQLQRNKWTSSQQEQVNPATGESFTPSFIPLLIGISQEGDGYPYDQILNGLTTLPNEMAMGATWNPDLASQVGSVLGKELSALGFNLLFGPVLDVLETPKLDGTIDLGTRTFGGDPFWVGEFGSAFIRGVHNGSDGRVAVVAKHFPGNGGSDRSPEEEVATVRKSLEELKNFDLAPFFAVTGDADTPEATVDALLASHIRYQGFQENIRATTRPVSFDPQAFNLLMNLPPLSTWRQNGGIMISDNLGNRAVRRFYELTSQTFDARRVVLNAFLAGNDLLYLGDITSGDDPNSYTSTVRVLDFFTQKYREDPAFAQRVDESVLRILTLKHRLYSIFSLGSTLTSMVNYTDIGLSSETTFEVARQSATLISPSLAEINDAIPDPPNQSDRIVFISDTRTTRQCSTCEEQPVLDGNALEQAVIRLYGPQAAGQVHPYNLSSFSFKDLEEMLDEKQEILPVEENLSRAHWVVFVMLNVNKEIPASLALPRFLTERPDLFQQKRLIVFALNAPYYLDTTNISKVTAYYALYSKTSEFIDVAARLLFQELQPLGSLPISVPGWYDLITATSPDPEQIISLYWDIPEPEILDIDKTPEPTQAPEFHVNDLIPIRTGIILDHNGHAVPDDTPVQFIITAGGEEVNAFPHFETTVAGVAQITIQVTSSGTWEIRAESELANQSDILRFDIPPEIAETVTVIPTVQQTTVSTHTPYPTEQTAIIAPTHPEPEIPTPARPDIVDWLLAVLLASGIAIFAYRLAARIGQVRWGVRSSFLALIGGITAYSYLALGLPGSEALLGVLDIWGVLLTTFIGSVIGIITTWSWRAIYSGSNTDK